MGGFANLSGMWNTFRVVLVTAGSIPGLAWRSPQSRDSAGPTAPINLAGTGWPREPTKT